MNIHTSCCNAAIVTGSKTEYPLGGSTWGINYKADYCEKCGEESPDTMETCDICGEPAEHFRHIDGDDYCPACFEERLQEAIGILRKKYGVNV